MLNKIISFLIFTYVIGSFGLSGVSGWSRLSLYSAVILVFLYIINIKKYKVPNWLIVFLFFYVYIIIPSVSLDNVNFDHLGTVLVVFAASFVTGVYLHNEILSYKTVVYGTIASVVINFIAILLGVDVGLVIEQGRSSGLLGNPNNLAMYCAYSVFLTCLIPNLFNKIVIFLNLTMSFYGIYASGSRKGLAMLVFIIMMIVADCLVKLNRLKLLVVSIISSLMIIGSYSAIIDFAGKYGSNLVVVERTVRDLSGQNQSLTNRGKLIMTGYDLWKESPLIGHGFSQFANLSGFSVYSHNNYIELAVTGGIVGLILFYSLYVYVFLNAFKFNNPIKPKLIIMSLSLLVVDTAAITFYDKASICTLVCLIVVSSRKYNYDELKQNF